MNLLASASIIEHFSSIPDPRLDRRKLHKLSDIFFITLCASICSANDWVAVEMFGKAKKEGSRCSAYQGGQKKGEVIARYSDFLKGTYNWPKLRWTLIKSELAIQPEKVYLLGGDEVVVTKSGKQTHGLGRFFSSLQNQVVPSLCFINVSLIDVESRNAYPLITEQLIRKKAQQSAPKAGTKKDKGKKGRPLGAPS